MELFHYFPSVTFVVLTGDQFGGRDDELDMNSTPARRVTPP